MKRQEGALMTIFDAKFKTSFRENFRIKPWEISSKNN